MWQGRKFHIEADVVFSGMYLIGTNNKGQTQTVEDILKGLSGSVEFSNITAVEVDVRDVEIDVKNSETK